MLNYFNSLFPISKSIEEFIAKRKVLMQKYGQEEALLEKIYCKRRRAGNKPRRARSRRAKL
jgi:hypothetical protein